MKNWPKCKCGAPAVHLEWVDHGTGWQPYMQECEKCNTGRITLEKAQQTKTGNQGGAMNFEQAVKAARLTRRQKEVLDQIPSDKWVPIDVIRCTEGWGGYRRIEKLQSAGLVATVTVEDQELFEASPEERLLWSIFKQPPRKTYIRRVLIPEREEFLRWSTSKTNQQFLEAIELKP